MGLSIKNAQLEADIRELAELEGLGLTEVLRRMVDERLDRRRRLAHTDREKAIGEILKIGAQLRRDVEASGRRMLPQKELDDEMYDEYGLPK